MANDTTHTQEHPAIIRFSFKTETREWFWLKEFHLHGRDLEDVIEQYLEQKKLPFEELTRDDIKWKRA